MAVTDAYADATQYRAAISDSGTTKGTDIDEQLMAASRFIDREMGRMPSGLPRHFTRDQAAMTRIFSPTVYGQVDPEAENPWKYTKGSRDLWVDDIADTTGLVIRIDENRDGSFVGETALAPTDYQLWPLNADKGAEKQPWTRIRLPEWSTRSGWQCGAMVEVTVPYGWPAIPRVISRATIDIVAIIRGEGPHGSRRAAEGLLDEITGADPEVEKVIARLARSYRRRRLFA